MPGGANTEVHPGGWELESGGLEPASGAEESQAFGSFLDKDQISDCGPTPLAAFEPLTGDHGAFRPDAIARVDELVPQTKGFGLQRRPFAGASMSTSFSTGCSVICSDYGLNY